MFSGISGPLSIFVVCFHCRQIVTVLHPANQVLESDPRLGLKDRENSEWVLRFEAQP